MDRDLRARIQRTTQAARALLEEDFAAQLGGTFDIQSDGELAPEAGPHLAEDPVAQRVRARLVEAVAHHRARGLGPAEAVAALLRESAFTTLNRFVALKLLEARGIVQECISRGEGSSGFREFSGLAAGLAVLPDHGFRLYVECLFDEIGSEVRVLFDRRDPASLLWPRRTALDALLGLLNDPDLAVVWQEDETIGWVYQFFNGEDERRALRDVKRGGSQAPRDSRELAVRNQFFTPRYVVEFLVDNTLGRAWVEMTGGRTALADRYRTLCLRPGEVLPPRAKKDPRDLRILDPACGSGHFLLYAFDLLLAIYEEAWADPESPSSKATRRGLRADYPELAALRRDLPGLILAHNLHGVDIDPRAAQIAALALWLRAQRAWNDFGIARAERPLVSRTHVVVAEPMPGEPIPGEPIPGEPIPGEPDLLAEFTADLDPRLAQLLRDVVADLALAGDAGTLLRIEETVEERMVALYPPQTGLFARQQARHWHQIRGEIDTALRAWAARAAEGSAWRRRLFASDADRGLAFVDACRRRYDVVLMNPPFGAGSLAAKGLLARLYPDTKHDLYAAFVERGVELLEPGGLLGAITSRTGFFLKSFQKWRERVILTEAPPVVFADLGAGVLDSAMVETAAYCLRKAVTESHGTTR